MPDNDLRSRTKDHLPATLLTLVSIVQALALELLWSHLREHEDLYQWSFATFLSWIQVAATFLGILLIWLIYTGIVMRFRWVPTTSDSVFPFLIGIIQFAMIAMLGADTLGQWFLTLSAIFAAMTWASQKTLRKARLDGENDAYFRSVARATLRDFYPPMAIVGLLAAAGGYLWMSGNQGWFALLALLGAISALGTQMWMNDVYWRRSLRNSAAVEQASG